LSTPVDITFNPDNELRGHCVAIVGRATQAEASRTLEVVDHSTDIIRKLLGISMEGNRVFCVMLFCHLYQITELVGEKF
jgi:hypothetical protein